MVAPGHHRVSEIESLDFEIDELRECRKQVRLRSVQAWVTRRSLDRQIAELEAGRRELEKRLNEELEDFDQRRANLGFRTPGSWSELQAWEDWFADQERAERLEAASQLGWAERDREYSRQFVERYRQLGNKQ